jgi:hypothetical protein
MNMKSNRPLTEFERAVISKLLEADFEGKSIVEDQLTDATASTIANTNDNYGSIKIFTTCKTKASVKDRVPVIANTQDESGAPVDILLHVVNGAVNELEFVRIDGQPMQGLPRLDLMRLEIRG